MNAGSRKRRCATFSARLLSRWVKFTPDGDLAEFLLEQEVKLEAKHGVPFWSLPAIRRDRMRDMQIVCPCIPFPPQTFRRHEAMLVRLVCASDVTDPDSLPQVPEKEMDLE